MADYQADKLELNRYRDRFKKFLEENKIYQFTHINVDNAVGAYSGRFRIDMQQHQIDVLYHSPKSTENLINAPDKARLNGLDFIITYTQVERDKISSATDIDAMRARAKKKK